MKIFKTLLSLLIILLGLETHGQTSNSADFSKIEVGTRFTTLHDLVIPANTNIKILTGFYAPTNAELAQVIGNQGYHRVQRFCYFKFKTKAIRSRIITKYTQFLLIDQPHAAAIAKDDDEEYAVTKIIVKFKVSTAALNQNADVAYIGCTIGNADDATIRKIKDSLRARYYNKDSDIPPHIDFGMDMTPST